MTLHIHLIIGPMFAGKSSFLLNYERKSLLAKRSVIVVKHSFDQRYTNESKITNHDGHISNTQGITCQKLLDHIDDIKKFNVILIDEGQFFDDLPKFLELVQQDSSTISHVVISGLSGDFQRKPFESISLAIPLADKVTCLNAICVQCGQDAPFSKRLVNSSHKTLVGASESYEPRCRHCF